MPCDLLELKMDQVVLLLFSLCLCGKVFALDDADLRLELASVLFRHGDRSPVHTFPTDPYNESDWPQGYGQLSEDGKRQHYHLGELLKDRYMVDGGCDGLICDNYTRVQVRIRSTDVDRTLMSAESQLASFFYPDASQRFNQSLPWQPIPVHTAPTMQDTILRPLDNCPIYNQLLESDKKSSPEYKAMQEKYKEFLANISVHAGTTINLTNVWIVEDTIKIEHTAPGYDAPSWATDDVRETLQTISDFTMFFMFNTNKKQRLSAGTWVGKILADMKAKMNTNGNKTLEDMKLFLYSAHDTTVAAMTSALNVTNKKQPGYATAFAVELYSNASGDYYVKMFRRDGPDSDTFNPLNASYCVNPTLCTLQEFEKYAMNLIPSDLAEECKISSPTTTTPTATPTATSTPQDLEKQNKTLRTAVIGLGSALGVMLIVTLILVILLISVSRKKNAKAQRLYSALSADT